MRKILVFALLIIIYPHIATAEETEIYLPLNFDSQKIIYVLINSESEISESKKIIIENIIMSKKVVMLNNQNYFEGWQGALDQISYSDSTSLRLVFTDSKKPSNMILINLKDESSEFDGFTKFELNENKITNSYITIYNSKELNNADFEKILCHEFGHSLGLGHSKNINDVMFPTLEQSNHYISNDNMSALSILYD